LRASAPSVLVEQLANDSASAIQIAWWNIQRRSKAVADFNRIPI
jgi:hypothetical protein